MTIKDAQDLLSIKRAYDEKHRSFKHRLLVCGGAGCVSSGCKLIEQALAKALHESGIAGETEVIETGCIGTCAVGPSMLVEPEGVFYVKLTPEIVNQIVQKHLIGGQVQTKHTFFDRTLRRHVPLYKDINFFKLQNKVALQNTGLIAPDDIEAYIARGGYAAAHDALTNMTREEVVREIKASGLSGRGGGGFPTGLKWEAGLKAEGDEKYVVANADEGDPGAFMDRSIMEGDPHALIEGLMIAGYAIGAKTGFVYVRAEYPLAIERLETALGQARDAGILGDNIFGSAFSFGIEIRIGAGAFVCGEETALMNSIEGKRGEPRQKPPFPFEDGIFSMPTIINNVETLANIAPIVRGGAAWFAGIGTEQSKGTKVFALAGDVANSGIVEVPIGTPLGNIVFDIGGGVPGGKQFKTVQIGGPSGGTITREQLNTPVDYEPLKKLGAIMGSGGLIVMNEDACMVDTARYFMEFIREESCGKCVACRIGTKRMLEILERITRGEGEEGDIDLLIELGETIKDTAVCGLGQTAPNPVLSAIQNFREEFEEHIEKHCCRAGVCGELFISPCENACPASVNVPGYTTLISQGRFVDAYNLIRQENPFPSVCGRICTRPCESKCRRKTLDEAVAICDLKRFVADYAHDHEKPYVRDIIFPKNGKRVAIVGAGAAGLTCGHYLTRIGYEVDVYEQERVAGGVLAYGIPEYRLPMDILAHEIELIEQEGVILHLNTEVGRDISFDQLKEESDAIFVATGTQIPQKIDIPGEKLRGVIHGIDFLKRVKLNEPVTLGERVVVIGGGNTAVDSARTALRLGAKSVVLMYRRTPSMMPAYVSEVQQAIEEGVEILPLTQPVKFIAGDDGRVRLIECQKMALGEFDSSGRRKSVPSEEKNFIVEADTVIPAISQYADLPFIPGGEIGRTRWGTFEVNEDTLMTTMEGVFAGGDIVRGPDSVIQAIADGKKAAIEIDRYLGGRGVLNKGEEIKFRPWADDDEVMELPRYPLDMLELDKRKGSFDEVVLGYHKLTAMAESMRCLHCERRS